MLQILQLTQVSYIHLKCFRINIHRKHTLLLLLAHHFFKIPY
nr:MAG TPA: hypothetical protein [Caudoviricetes sp.]